MRSKYVKCSITIPLKLLNAATRRFDGPGGFNLSAYFTNCMKRSLEDDAFLRSIENKVKRRRAVPVGS